MWKTFMLCVQWFYDWWTRCSAQKERRFKVHWTCQRLGSEGMKQDVQSCKINFEWTKQPHHSFFVNTERQKSGRKIQKRMQNWKTICLVMTKASALLQSRITKMKMTKELLMLFVGKNTKWCACFIHSKVLTMPDSFIIFILQWTDQGALNKDFQKWCSFTHSRKIFKTKRTTPVHCEHWKMTKTVRIEGHMLKPLQHH